MNHSTPLLSATVRLSREELTAITGYLQLAQLVQAKLAEAGSAQNSHCTGQFLTQWSPYWRSFFRASFLGYSSAG